MRRIALSLILLSLLLVGAAQAKVYIIENRVTSNTTNSTNYTAGYGLNLSGTAFSINDSLVCTSTNGLCAANGTADGTGGWTNTSTTTSTSLDVGISTSSPAKDLEVNGTARVTLTTNTSRYADLSMASSNRLDIDFGGTGSLGGYLNIEQVHTLYGFLIHDNSNSSKWGGEGLSLTNGNYRISTSATTADLDLMGNNFGTSLLYLEGDASAVGINDNTPDAQLDVQIGSATQEGLIIQGAASQSANLQEWQNSSGGVLASVEDDGKFNINNIDIYSSGGVDWISSSAASGLIIQDTGGALGLKGSSFQMNYNNGATGGWWWYGGGTVLKFSVDKDGNAAAAGIVNATGKVYSENKEVCTATNGLCNSTNGWTNTSTTTSTTLNVNISGNTTIKNNTGGATLLLLNNGHIVSDGGTPEIHTGDCGSDTEGTIGSGSTDIAGRVTAGTSGMAETLTCTLTFAHAWTSPPSCTVIQDTAEGAGASDLGASTTNTTFSFIAGVDFSSVTFMYLCIGYQ